MEVNDFKRYFKYLLEWSKFNNLLKINAMDVPEAKDYILSRKLDTNLCDFFYYDGRFIYGGREYILSKCIVVPLYSEFNTLNGVWIRFIHEKRFYIWMLNIEPQPQKFWIPKDIDFEDTVYVCEGIFDAISLSKMINTKQVVACLGVKPTTHLKSLLNDVVLCLDFDTAGKKSALDLLISNPEYSIIKTSTKEKDFNDILIKSGKLDYTILKGIQARIFIRSIL